MIRLNAEQVQRLQQIQLERDTRHLAEVLGGLFPDVPGRLGERYLALIGHAVQRGKAQGLVHALCLARYLACWFMLGAEFEAKAGHEWARELLADPQRSQGAKVFQLCRRTSEALARLKPGPGQTAPAQFNAAIAALDERLMDFGTLGALQRGGRVKLGQACDIDALDIRLVETVAHRHYVVEQGQWCLLPRPGMQAPVTLSAGAPTTPAVPAAPAGGAPVDARPTALPPRLSVLSPTGGVRPARLRLRTLAATCCDPQLHPLVRHIGAQGPIEWRGPQASDIALDLYAAEPEAPAEGDLQPLIAAESARELSVLTVTSCGLRDAGASLGEQTTHLAVHPAEQHLLVWRREECGELIWPEPASGQVAAPRALCRIERDGMALDAARWQAGLEELDRQLADGLSRLYTAWGRESGVARPRMQAKPAVLVGDAGLTWGWAEGAKGIQSPPFLRLAGRFDLVACRLDLRLAGELALQGSMSRVQLQSHGHEALKPAWQRGATDPSLLPLLTPAAVQFRHPFVLQLDSIAQAETAVLDASPATGAVVGACGLRARADGRGLQWFAKLSVEPVMATLRWHDPLLGQEEMPRPLLPALTLLDWSLG